MLVGPSGCGKSTLLHLIYGLEEPTSGKIWIDGLDIWSKSKNWRADFRNRNIGFIPQQPFWIKSFSVLENIAIPATISGESFSSALERAAKLIQLIHMEHRSDNRPYDLSGGEQQKIAMARALLMNPKFIIADEPTGNLDQKSGEDLMKLFKELNKTFNITILMVTHNPDQYKYCTKLVQMLDGQIIGQKKMNS
jgi:ABC-type lipoprotein export system ATPase subunit